MDKDEKYSRIREVLYGHRVSDSIDRQALGPDSINTIHPVELRRLLKSRKDWIKINPENLTIEQLFKKQDIPQYLLTFDDGYKDNLTTALPIIEEANVPMIVFITTEFVDGNRCDTETQLAAIINSVSDLRITENQVVNCLDADSKWRVYRELVTKLKKKGRLCRDNYILELIALNKISNLDLEREFLNWDDVLLLDKHPLVTIGAHSMSHSALPSLRLGDAYKEIKGAKIELERKLKHSVEFFSYPYGSRTLILDWLVRRAGFRLGFSTEPRMFSSTWPLGHYRVPRKNLVTVAAESNSLINK